MHIRALESHTERLVVKAVEPLGFLGPNDLCIKCLSKKSELPSDKSDALRNSVIPY